MHNALGGRRRIRTEEEDVQPQSLEDTASAHEHGQPGDNRLSARIAQAREIAQRAQRDERYRIGSTAIAVEHLAGRAAPADDLERGDD